MIADAITNPSSPPRRRSWAILGLLVVAHAIFNLLLNPIGGPVANSIEWLGITLIGVVFTQPALFAVWGVLGPGPSVKRFPLTVAALAAVVLAGHVTAWSLLTSVPVSDVWDGEYAIMAVTVFIIATAAMLLVRKMTRWRIGHISAAHGDVSHTNQFSLKYLLGLTAACAVMLGIMRSLSLYHWLPDSADWPDMNLTIVAWITMVCFAALPALIVPFIALSQRVTVRMLLSVPILWAVLTSLAVEIIVAVQSEPRWETAGEIGFLQLGAATAGALSAWMLRLAGYRLLSPAPASSAVSNQ